MTPEQVKADLAKMETAFRAASKEHFNITLSEARLFEKGSYRVLYARPTKRMSQVLGVHREIIVLVTNFPELQNRVVKAARDWISNEPSGRLEPHYAIVVHSDEQGYKKLRDWGRGQGLTILPISASTCPADPLQFERLLAEEFFQWDPFDITGPVAADFQFYGRKQDAVQYAQRLQTGQILSLLGIRKMGKTSLLNRVVSICREQYECDVVVLDGSLDAIWPSNAAGILSAIRESIANARISKERYAAIVSAPRKSDLAGETSALVAEVLKGVRPLILVVDEVDYLTPGSPTAVEWRHEFNRLWRNIRGVYQEALRQGKPFSVFVSGVSSKWFSVGEIENVENAALAFVPESYLGPLSLAASASMIKDLGGRCGLRFDQEACERISKACACMPYWVRKACSLIHRSVEVQTRPKEIDVTQADRFIGSFMETEGAELSRIAMTHLFKVYPELRSASETASQPTPSTSARSSRDKATERYGLVSLDSGNFVMPLIIRAGLDALQAEEALSRPDLPNGTTGSGSEIGDWAEELAIISSRRNRLERKLRRVVLGLIRADVVRKKGDSSQVGDRIRASVPSDRRRNLPIDPDELVEKLFWLELLALLEKEWELVGTIFGSAAELKSHGQIINERPDAHSKVFDAADLALWRRSLEWFESRAQRV